MKRSIFGVLALAAVCAAQQTERRIEQREIRVTVDGTQPVMAGMIGADGHMGLLNVPGKPFSATEERRTVQMLANGAKIEHSDSSQMYRDDQGRTRSEQTIDGKTTVAIMDPVGHFVAILDRVRKTVHKTPIPPEVARGEVSVSGGKVTVMMAAGSGTGFAVRQGQQVKAEDLHEKLVSGLIAQGTRETRTIKAGAIGNDRDLDIVDERWFSSDLQVLVKSLNNDPRFGETSYQLTNIVRGAQDPALFQIPPDYTVIEGMK